MSEKLLLWFYVVISHKEILLNIGASLVVAVHAVRKGAAAEGMKVRDYIWRGHDPTAVAVMTEVIECVIWVYRLLFL